MPKTVEIGAELTFEDVVAVARGATVDIASHVPERMAAARAVVDDAVTSGKTVYGITTGFGGLANVRIERSQAEQLQRDVVRSHATAVGPRLPTAVARAMLLLKARTFAFGASGVRFELVERIATLLNHRVHPIVPAQGSLGASGDLALLAHLSLPLMGEGKVEHDGEVMDGGEGLRRAGLEPLQLSHKEGLSLVNGTEGMLALGVLGLTSAERLCRAADVCAAMTVEACFGTDRTFDADLIALRKHDGARTVAGNLRSLLADSDIVASHRESEHLVQDAYSLRCIPQVHGAYRDALQYVRKTLEVEMRSAVDNPSVIIESGEVLSGGNFHGEALALALDHMALCLAGFATISERRIARLVDPQLSNGLPAFLTPEPGLRSGFMLAHYTAASLVAESRSLCFPVSSDTIPTSAGQEDHVSMGATAGRKALDVLANSAKVVAIEALAAAQGLDLRAPLSPAPATGAARGRLREVSPQLVDDRPLADEIEAATDVVIDGALVESVEQVVGNLA